MFDCKKTPLDIIVMAGQSNAEGNGVSSDDNVETRNDVFELVDFNNYWRDADPNNPVLRLTLPVQCKMQCLQERFTPYSPSYDFSLSFVDEFKKSPFYNPHRKLIVIKAAIGGTGFCKNEWGKGNFLYKRLTDMVDLALSLNDDNRIVALLWHQGECDAFENPDISDKERHDIYYEKLLEQMDDFKNRYSQHSFPIIMGEFCNEWSNKKENFAKTQAVELALRDCAKTLGNSLVVSSEGLKSNNEEIGNGDDIHFSKPSLVELGKRYFVGYKKIVDKNYTKFLMIANSFGVNLQTYASDIAKANDCNLDIYVLYIGGCSLDTHWRNIQNDAKAYELFHNGVSTGEFISIKDALNKEKWDYISLQQASHMCAIESTYYPYFGHVYDYVKEQCPSSEIIFHKTWAYSPINSYKYETVPAFFPDFKCQNAKEMKEKIDYCTNKIVKEFNIKTVIRSGDVCELAVKEIGDVYDYQGFHMNQLGSYLIGCNLIKTLFKKKLTSVFVPENLGKKTCEAAVKFINDNF